jgi:hypothetical protein
MQKCDLKYGECPDMITASLMASFSQARSAIALSDVRRRSFSAKIWMAKIWIMERWAANGQG